MIDEKCKTIIILYKPDYSSIDVSMKKGKDAPAW